jgi:hypothetical protein
VEKMNIQIIKKEFEDKVSRKINLIQEGIDRFRIDTPFLFEDGDNLVIILKNSGGQWYLTDEGHTFMHLTYDINYKDFQKGVRQKIISNAIAGFGLCDNQGELIIQVTENTLGDSLYSFIQGILKISDIEYLSRERVKSTFMEDLFEYLEKTIPEERRSFRYHDKQLDPAANYVIDCRINGMAKPIYVFGLTNDEKVRDATITLHQFERWSNEFKSVGIFHDQENISRKVLARFTDVVDRQFSSLASNHERISRYFEESLNSSR